MATNTDNGNKSLSLIQAELAIKMGVLSDTDTSKQEPELIVEKQDKQIQQDSKCQSPGPAGPLCYKALPGAYKYATHLSYWTVDENASKFWNLYGKSIANKNLWISIGNLLLAFAVWLVWSIVGVLLLNSWEATNGEYYHFSSWKKDMTKVEYKATLWLLPATAGLSGATLRLTNSFMIGPSGGRNVISQTSVLLLIAVILLTIALNNTDVSMQYLIVIALISGAGGGAFASSMSNISFFYPKSKQGLALGLNAGIGNLGVSVMQLLIPIMVTYAAYGKSASIYVDEVGYIANAAIFWIQFLVIFIISAWFFMNSLPTEHAARPIINAIGAMFLWYGWFAFSKGIEDAIGTTALVTVISPISASGSAFIWKVLGIVPLTFENLINCLLAGLVAITGMCHTWEAVFIGACASIVYFIMVHITRNKWGLDDPLEVISIHLFCGILSGIAEGIVANDTYNTSGLIHGPGKPKSFKHFGVQVNDIQYDIEGNIISGKQSELSTGTSTSLLGCQTGFYNYKSGMDITKENIFSAVFDSVCKIVIPHFTMFLRKDFEESKKYKYDIKIPFELQVDWLISWDKQITKLSDKQLRILYHNIMNGN